MKKCVLPLLLCFFFAGTAGARTPQNKPFIYTQFGAGGGSGAMLNASLTWLQNEHTEWSLTAATCLRRGSSVPDDFDAGWTEWSSGRPQDHYSFGAITYGYVFRPGYLHDRTRFVLRGGLAFGQISQPVNFQSQVPLDDRSPNYSFGWDRKNSLGILLHPTFEVFPSAYFGVSMGPYAVLTPPVSFAGFSVNVMLGKIANKNQHYAAWRAGRREIGLRKKEEKLQRRAERRNAE